MNKHQKGTIKFFSYRRGYGFIVCDNLDEDVFFHFTSIVNNPGVIVYLIPGENVFFELIKGPRGYLARNVTSKNKANVKVNNIYYHYYYSFRKIVDDMIEDEIEKEHQ